MGKIKVGYLGGCFDLFHIGHLNYIREAKKYCDYLVVEVTPDRVVYEQKHKLPVIGERDRLEVVRSIRYVDRAELSDNDRDRGALDKYGFNVLFLSEDHLGKEYYENLMREMRERGVEVIYLPYTKGISSTQIKAAISNDALGRVDEEAD